VTCSEQSINEELAENALGEAGLDFLVRLGLDL
jgi:hypothetical protein